VKKFLLKLRKDGYIHAVGRTNAVKWHPAPMKNQGPLSRGKKVTLKRNLT